MTTAQLLTALKDEIQRRFGYDATILYARNADVAELTKRRVVLQPSLFSVERTGKSDPRRVFAVDLISEEHVGLENVEATARARVAELETVANSFTRLPFLGETNAFCQSVKTFDDAPAVVNSAIVENGYALVLSGVRMTFVEN